MKVLFTTYFSAFQNPGGGEIVLLKTREALQKQGITVDLFSPWESRINQYDIVHDFSLHSWRNWSAFKTYGPKLVVTPVCWPHIQFPYPQKEQLKYVLEILFSRNNPENSFAEALKLPDLILPTTQMEMDRIKQRYRTTQNSHFEIIPNGISLNSFKENHVNTFVEKFNCSNYLLYVGRITKIKNIEMIIYAAKKMNRELFIIGEVNKDEHDYLKWLKEMATDKIHFLGKVPHDSPLLQDAYRGASALVVASFFETCSLVGLEAATYGTKVIMTESGATKEIYKDYVEYVNPHDYDSLIHAIEKNESKKFDLNFKDHIVKNYTWDHISNKLIKAYEGILRA